MPSANQNLSPAKTGSFLSGCFVWHGIVGLLIRMALIVYGEHHDTPSAVHYTDVDYHVITDAAFRVSAGKSPFDRYTYRYSPLLACFMLPNVWWHHSIGKLIFCILDCLATWLVYVNLKFQGFNETSAVRWSLLILYNPIIIGISTRGSAESVIITTVLLVLFFHQRRRVVLAGVFLGFGVHFKLYPIIYSLPLYLSLEKPLKTFSFSSFCVTNNRFLFTLSAITSFGFFTFFAYFLYGFQYLEESFLYHITRTDTRHNFSPYFYLLYLSVDFHVPGLRFATFTPQIVLVLAYGTVLGQPEHVTAAMFAQTVAFVTFNKVVTSQYFVWYLALLPLVAPHLNLLKRKGKTALLCCLWLLALFSWLLPAYLFEFKGLEVFIPIWLESLAFFSCNIGVLMAIMTSYIHDCVKSKKFE